MRGSTSSPRTIGIDIDGQDGEDFFPRTPILAFPHQGGRNFCWLTAAAVVAEGAVSPFEGGFEAVFGGAAGEFLDDRRLVGDGVGSGGDVLEGVASHKLKGAVDDALVGC